MTPDPHPRFDLSPTMAEEYELEHSKASTLMDILDRGIEHHNHRAQQLAELRGRLDQQLQGNADKVQLLLTTGQKRAIARIIDEVGSDHDRTTFGPLLDIRDFMPSSGGGQQQSQQDLPDFEDFNGNGGGDESDG